MQDSKRKYKVEDCMDDTRVDSGLKRINFRTLFDIQPAVRCLRDISCGA
ncbi:MAG: hypothetical protein ACLVIY_05640 [Anaerobutyricum soehngenii]